MKYLSTSLRNNLIEWAGKYNDPLYFKEDPISFPRRFLERGAGLQDVEVAAVFAAHLAWGRRSMIVRDCSRLFDEMEWEPYRYIMGGQWRSDSTSIHRTVKWCEIAGICSRLKDYYSRYESLERLSQDEMRTMIFAQKSDLKAPNKKINMMRRWMVRDDGKVDLGLWKHSDKNDLVIPLDVHVYGQAFQLGLTERKQKDITTALEITDFFRDIFPGDPAKGDFALFGYGVTHNA